MKRFALNPVARLSFGLTALVVSFVLFLDIVGIIPDREEAFKAVRQRISENLGIQVALILRQGDMTILGKVLREVVEREPDIQSIAIRKLNGELLTQLGEHARHWRPPSDKRSNADNVRVPLYANNEPWGNLELSFRSSTPESLSDWLNNHLVSILLVLGVAGFISFYLYLKRALLYLDPTTAVPERVRRAFDSLSEGIMILDHGGRIMLTNSAFKRLHPAAREALVGYGIKEQTWLTMGLTGEPAQHPWNLAIREGKTSEGLLLEIAQPDGTALKTVLNVTPVLAPNGAPRGCLISINDTTELHRINEELLSTVLQLEQSRQQIDQQNKELQMIANRDPLTGCLNRRAFFASMEELYVKAKADNTDVCCIMTDIDHFKSFNDRYGHAVGDEVIRAVVRGLQSGLRQQDLLCRYGGEEFCIILPNTPVDQAMEVAERLRAAIEQHAGASLRDIKDVRVTSSFGVARLDHAMLDPAELINQADDALYQSKRNGRNRVSVWSLESAQPA